MCIKKISKENLSELLLEEYGDMNWQKSDIKNIPNEYSKVEPSGNSVYVKRFIILFDPAILEFSEAEFSDSAGFEGNYVISLEDYQYSISDNHLILGYYQFKEIYRNGNPKWTRKNYYLFSNPTLGKDFFENLKNDKQSILTNIWE